MMPVQNGDTRTQRPAQGKGHAGRRWPSAGPGEGPGADPFLVVLGRDQPCPQLNLELLAAELRQERPAVQAPGPGAMLYDSVPSKLTWPYSPGRQHYRRHFPGVQPVARTWPSAHPRDAHQACPPLGSPPKGRAVARKSLHSKSWKGRLGLLCPSSSSSVSPSQGGVPVQGAEPGTLDRAQEHLGSRTPHLGGHLHTCHVPGAVRHHG